ncbi:GNAT family N-acetyltransferase [Frankia sp. AgB32]|uniref:GNAT family N-acetyltransferase n=1 Tax=Frankia sp. AgB32 TaxID=631119 RepID=UPI00200D8533|nr:GNAT family N-acetyltransferase [Frankia sp. AgB32]MCK9895192.1 GNAT family N-acetyltransferase [Frankia sp. AgB32]
MTLTYGAPSRTEIPTVLTSRLILRGWRPADLSPYAAMNADPETMRYLNGPFGQVGTERLVTHLLGMWMLHGHGMWAVEERGTGEFLGRAGSYAAEGWPGIDVAVSIRRDRWGHGLGTEAIRASLEFGFERLPVAELITTTHRDNVGMNAIARRLGMTFRGVADVGPWRASNVYAISREQWQACGSTLPPTGDLLRIHSRQSARRRTDGLPCT